MSNATIDNNFESEYLTSKEASILLGISVTTFWRYVKLGKIEKGINFSPRCIRWQKKDIQNFIDNAKLANL